MLKLAHWFNEVETSGFKSFSILKNTITHHYNDILNYFEARSTNASVEFLMQKSKLQIVTERVYSFDGIFWHHYFDRFFFFL